MEQSTGVCQCLSQLAALVIQQYHYKTTIYIYEWIT